MIWGWSGVVYVMIYQKSICIPLGGKIWRTVMISMDAPQGGDAQKNWKRWKMKIQCRLEA